MEVRHSRSVRDHNRRLILREIDKSPGISRSEITAAIGLTDAAVSRITRELIEAGVLREISQTGSASRPGRRHVGLSIVPGGGYIVCACFTLFRRSLSVVDLGGRVLRRTPISDILDLKGDEFAAALAEAVKQIVADADVPWERVLGLAIVTAGAIDYRTGTVTSSALKGLVGIPLGQIIEARLNRPVRLETIGNALNIAELRVNRSCGRQGTSLLIHSALAMGVSLVTDGRPHRCGFDERMIGHIPLPGGTEICDCGAIGCLITQVSGRALLRAFGRGDVSDSRQRDFHAKSREAEELSRLLAESDRGHEKLTAALRDAGRVLGNNLFSICSAALPDRVILGGPLPQASAFVSGVEEGWSRPGRARVIDRRG